MVLVTVVIVIVMTVVIYDLIIFSHSVMEDKFDIIWDRGALGAINTSDRKQ